MNNKKISDKEILIRVMDAIPINASMLAREINVSKAALYEVTQERNILSKKMKLKIIERFPQINIDYLNTGLGDICIKKHVDVYKKLDLLEEKINYLIKKLE